MEINPNSTQRENVENVVVADSSKRLRTEDSPIALIAKQWKDIRNTFLLLLSPGDSQFKDIPKRVRLMIISFAIPLLHLLFKASIIPAISRLMEKYNIAVPEYLLTGSVILLLAVTTYYSLIWGMKKQVRRESYYSIILVGAMFSVATTIFLYVIFTGILSSAYIWGLFVFATSVFMVLLYILSLIINILNVNLFYTIPLSRLGESGIYIFSIVIYFLLALSYVNIVFPLILTFKWVLLSAVSLIFFIAVLVNTGAILYYFLPNNRDIWGIIISSSSSLFVISILFFLTFTYGWIAAIASSLAAYVVYGYLIHKQQNSLKNIVKIEFILIIIAIIITAIAQ